MKSFSFVCIAGLLLLASCAKPKTYANLPGLQQQHVVDSLASLRAWVEQIAIEKRDSLRIVDSLAAATGVVNVNSLFHKKNMMIAIVEVNDHYFPNVNCMVDQQGKPIFDLAFPFSANLNIDPGTGKASVFYNPEHQAMLRNGTFRKVQNAGIPVGLSLLGNHDAAGFSNFASLADATAFAQLVAIEVRRNGFSAVLTDDEYSGYNPAADPNSYLMVMSEIKRLLPDIFLCYYVIGGGYGTYNGKQMGDIADAVFPDYGGSPNVMNFPKSKWFYSFIEGGSSFSPQSTAQQVKQEGSGGMMFFNVTGGSSVSSFYGPVALTLKNQTLQIPPGCLNGTEADFINGQ